MLLNCIAFLSLSEMNSPLAIIFANLKGNLGDFAILHSMLDLAGRTAPGRPVHVYPHPLHTIDAERLAEFSKVCPPCVFEPATFVAVRTVAEAVRQRLAARVLKGRDLFKEAWDPQPWRAFSRYGSILVAGGDQWCGRELSRVMFGTIRAISDFNSNIVAFPFSVKSSLLRSVNVVSARHAFGLLRRPMVVRDSSSFEILSKLGLPVELGADCVLSLAPDSFHTPNITDAREGRILVVVKGSAEGLRGCLAQLGAYRSRIDLLTTCATEDEQAYMAVAQEFGLRVIRPMTWQQAVGECKASSLVIANRLHGLIFAALAGTAVLPVTDRAKARSFAKDAGLDLFVPDPAAISEELVGRALSERQRICALVSAYRASASSSRERLLETLQV